MPIELRYRLRTTPTRGPAALFAALLENRVGPRFDNIHKQVAIQLTTTAKEIIESNIDRPQERGQRKRFRRTGTLTGHSGRRSAIEANTTGRGGGQRQGRGVRFPNVAKLDRRAAHWRAIEYGVSSVKLPTGFFLDGGGNPLVLGGPPGVFHTYGEGLRATGLTSRKFGLSSRSRQARQRRVGNRDLGGRDSQAVLWKRGEARGYQGKHYLSGSWEQVVGPNGENIMRRYQKAIEEELAPFKLKIG